LIAPNIFTIHFKDCVGLFTKEKHEWRERNGYKKNGENNHHYSNNHCHIILCGNESDVYDCGIQQRETPQYTGNEGTADEAYEIATG
jgi:hypothetical protein